MEAVLSSDRVCTRVGALRRGEGEKEKEANVELNISSTFPPSDWVVRLYLSSSAFSLWQTFCYI